MRLSAFSPHPRFRGEGRKQADSFTEPVYQGVLPTRLGTRGTPLAFAAVRLRAGRFFCLFHTV